MYRYLYCMYYFACAVFLEPKETSSYGIFWQFDDGPVFKCELRANFVEWADSKWTVLLNFA
jgi:hypothetical protein